jgi:2-polyprenyl-6-methoxyphenol hydroxylase-like FAD-dependent oxidoreductase
MSAPLTIEILGAGPAGLYTAILIRTLLPQAVVRVTEQNPEGATFGFGVVFSDQALAFLRADDPETHDLIVPHMERWRNMTLNLPGGQVVLDGVGFTSIGRLHLIEILKARAQALGVPVRFNTRIEKLEDLAADLVIGADGLNSLVRQSLGPVFAPRIEHFNNRFAWFGATVPFDTLTQTFINTDHGAMNAHHYRYEAERSTFIVECDDATYAAHGFARMTEAESAAYCSDLFKDVLGGTALVTNRSNWRQFPRLWCENWTAGNCVLIGDAAHTAHFSIGSGTRLALEDGLALVKALQLHGNVPAALEAFQASRPTIARKIVDAANTSAVWYETFAAKMQLPPMDFAFDYLTRSGRLTTDRLRQLAPKFMADFEARADARSMENPDAASPQTH